jgi:hypothetical protein
MKPPGPVTSVSSESAYEDAVAETDELLRRAAHLKSGPNATFAELEAALMEVADAVGLRNRLPNMEMSAALNKKF